MCSKRREEVLSFIAVIILALIVMLRSNIANAQKGAFIPSFETPMESATESTSEFVLESTPEPASAFILEFTPEPTSEFVLKSTPESTSEFTSELPLEPIPEPSPVLRFPQFAEEEYLLAQIIYCEAGGCSTEEMGFTGSVVINRALTEYCDFASVDTIEEVLYQGYGTSRQQYDGWTISQIESGIQPSEEAISVAKGLIEGTIEKQPEHVLFQFASSLTPWSGIVVLEMPSPTQNIFSRPKDFWVEN